VDQKVSESLSEREALAARVLSLLDLTSLGENDTPTQIENLCASAWSSPVLPAAMCIYPEHITTARQFMIGTPAKIATVVNFPDGSSDALRVERETRRAIGAGADEIDLVFPYKAMMAGDAKAAASVVRACRKVCGPGVLLKLIIESGELKTSERIIEACVIGLTEGVDFLKTSTGKVPVNATPMAAALMLDVITAAGGQCGFKAAGGIRTLEDAKVYLNLAEERLGSSWVHQGHFRIGASALFTELVAIVAGPEDNLPTPDASQNLGTNTTP
jgi:deoxyribose-phosphate aldolase